MRTSYIQINGVIYDKSQAIPQQEVPIRASPVVHGDLPDFASPIDGTVVKGRAGLRDHCARHNVILTAELAGLPIRQPEAVPDRGAIREDIRRQLYK